MRREAKKKKKKKKELLSKTTTRTNNNDNIKITPVVRITVISPEIVHAWRTEREIFVQSPFDAELAFGRARGTRRERVYGRRDGGD